MISKTYDECNYFNNFYKQIKIIPTSSYRSLLQDESQDYPFVKEPIKECTLIRVVIGTLQTSSLHLLLDIAPLLPSKQFFPYY